MRQKGVGLAQRSACERIGFSEIGAGRIRAGLMKVVLAGWVLPADGSPLATIGVVPTGRPGRHFANSI